MNRGANCLVKMCGALLVSVISLSSALAHPGHIALTEIEWNESSLRYEVAMKLRIADLQDGLALQEGRRIPIEDTAAIEAALQKYLATHFRLFQSKKDSCQLHWVGYELELHDVWIYFEAQLLPKSPTAAKTVSAFEPGIPHSGLSRSADTWDRFLHAAHSEPPPLSGRLSVLTDVQPDQTNIVQLKVGGHRVSLLLTRGNVEFTAFSPPQGGPPSLTEPPRLTPAPHVD